MKRIILLLIVFLSYSLTVFLSPPARAAESETPWLFGGDFDASVQEGVGGGNNAESWVVGNFANFMPNALNMALIGVSSNTIEKIARGEPLDPKFYSQIQQRSVLGGTSRAIAMIYSQPPANFGYWLADVGQTLGFIAKPTYAQGIGFSGLSALLPVWKAFRNIAYLILAVVMIVIGFMVMLRKKIDPKTVVTVQNALPRIVITLILITFSYAIVGFLIDLMYLLILLVVAVVGPSIKDANIPELQAAFTAGGFGEVINRMFSPLATFFGLTAVGAVLPGFLALVGTLTGAPGIIIGIILGLVGSCVAGAATGVGCSVGVFSPLLLLLIGIAIIVTLIRVLLLLVNAYIQVIVALLFGPLQIMMDAIPGSNGFTSWLNNLIVNLLTFPVVATLIIIGTSITSNISGNFWQPPLVPKTALGGFGSDTSQFLQALLGLSILMMIPTIVHGIKEALKIKPALPISAGSVTAPIGAAGGVAMQGLSQIYYMQMLTGKEGFLNKIWSAVRGGK